MLVCTHCFCFAGLGYHTVRLYVGFLFYVQALACVWWTELYLLCVVLPDVLYPDTLIAGYISGCVVSVACLRIETRFVPCQAWKWEVSNTARSLTYEWGFGLMTWESIDFKDTPAQREAPPLER